MAEPVSVESVGPAKRPGAAPHPATNRQEADEQTAAAQIVPPLALRVGPLTVHTGAAEVEAFRLETCGALNGKGVPFTFPVCWFVHPAIRAAGAELIGPEPSVPIHESQSFDYAQSLEMDVAYQMTVEISRERDPSRLILRAEIGGMESGSAICLRMEMILRIISTGGAESLT